MKIKVGTLCSGYDSQCMALDRLKENFPNFDYELVFWSEIDKYAIQAHNAVYPQYAHRNLGDMTKIDWAKVDKVDLLTYSTPCTDISNAGQQKGIEKGSGTRSSILWYTEEAIRILRPKYLLMENVSALVSQKFIPYFHEWQNVVAGYGYSNFTQVLNAKDYGVPQNRERVFMISVLEGNYHFPKPFKLERRLKDVLESNVEEKYYLRDTLIKYFENRTRIAKAITTCAGSRTDDNFIIDEQATTKNDSLATVIMEKEKTDVTICLNSKVDGKQPSLEHRIYDSSGISTAITTGFLSSVTEPQVEQIGNIYPDTDDFKNRTSGRVYSSEGLSPTLRTVTGGHNEPKITEQQYRIRKLTPRECFRLMDVSEDDIDKIQASGVSNSQQYKLAGNSIVVSCLYHLFRKMFVETENEQKQLNLF